VYFNAEKEKWYGKHEKAGNRVSNGTMGGNHATTYREWDKHTGILPRGRNPSKPISLLAAEVTGSGIGSVAASRVGAN